MQKTYKVLMHKEPEGTYTVSVPALPGCMTYGDTVEVSLNKSSIYTYSPHLTQSPHLHLAHRPSPISHRPIGPSPISPISHRPSPHRPSPHLPSPIAFQQPPKPV